MARVTLDRVSKVFHGPRGRIAHALRDFSLTVEDGELLVLVGPSGSGKTTALRLIAGLEEPSSGGISLDGAALDDVPARDRDIAMVFQHHALYPHMTVFENLAFGLKLRRVPRTEIERRVRDAAETLDLASSLDARPENLSGGQRQRVALGRALVRQPKVFLLDEPLSNLDQPMRVQMRRELAGLHARLGVTMIYVTHDQTEALTLGQRIAVLNEGALQQVGQPMSVYREPGNLFVAGFIGSPPMNVFRGTLLEQGGHFVFQERTANGEAGFSVNLDPAQAFRMKDRVGTPVVLGLRPEQFRVTASPTPGANVTAMVKLVELTGTDRWLHCDSGSLNFVARAPASVPARAGERISAQLEMADAQFFDASTGLAIPK